MGLLEGRTVLVTGVTMHTSIAFKAAQIAQDEGARVIVSNLPRAVGVTRRAVRKLDPVPEVLELDVTDADQTSWLPCLSNCATSEWKSLMVSFTPSPSLTPRRPWGASFSKRNGMTSRSLSTPPRILMSP